MIEWTITYAVYNEQGRVLKGIVQDVWAATERAAKIEAEKRAAKLCKLLNGDYWLVHSVK